MCEADRSPVELLIYVVQKPWEPERSGDSSDALEGSGEGVDVRRAGLRRRAWLRRGVVGLVAARDLLRHASPEAEQARERVSHKHPIRRRLGELRLRPGDDLVDKGIERFLGAVAKVGSLGKNARGTPGREVLFPQVNANVHEADAFRYLNGGVVGNVTQEVNNRSSCYRGHLRVDGKSGDSRFSRHGVGGTCCRVGGGTRIWCSAHATHSTSFAGSRRFRAGERQPRGR